LDLSVPKNIYGLEGKSPSEEYLLGDSSSTSVQTGQSYGGAFANEGASPQPPPSLCGQSPYLARMPAPEVSNANQANMSDPAGQISQGHVTKSDISTLIFQQRFQQGGNISQEQAVKALISAVIFNIKDGASATSVANVQGSLIAHVKERIASGSLDGNAHMYTRPAIYGSTAYIPAEHVNLSQHLSELEAYCRCTLEIIASEARRRRH
jgi:hypothetical protein